MSIELTEQQSQALAAARELPLRVIDPASRITYVVLRADTYDRIRSLAVEQDDVRRMEPLLAELSPEDWEDAADYEARP